MFLLHLPLLIIIFQVIQLLLHLFMLQLVVLSILILWLQDPKLAYSATKHPLPINLEYVPTTYLQASKYAHWRSAMQEEFNALQSTGTWSLVPASNSQNIVGCKWVFRIKKKPDGIIDRYKARHVAKRFHQQAGIDYQDTLSPVAKPVTIIVLLSLVVQFNWFLNQLDISNVFLHGVLKEDVYMEQPGGFIDPSLPHHVCKLRKSLYGLKQAPRAWFDKLFQALHTFVFVQSFSDASLFVFKGHVLVIVLVYVDDILVTGPNPAICQSFIQKLSVIFPVKDLGPLHCFLGLEFKEHLRVYFFIKASIFLIFLKRPIWKVINLAALLLALPNLITVVLFCLIALITSLLLKVFNISLG